MNSVSQSFANGANVVTMPPAVFDKMYNHVLTDKGLQFMKDTDPSVFDETAMESLASTSANKSSIAEVFFLLVSSVESFSFSI